MIDKTLTRVLVVVAFGIAFAHPGVAKATLSFGTPVNLGPVVNSGDLDSTPSISADDLTLYFYSDRSGGLGGRDMWSTTRSTTSDPWGTPTNLGTPVNTSSNEASPSISSDGLTLFFEHGIGNPDIWMSARPTTSDPWGTPVNLGPTVNSSVLDADPEISADGLTLVFGSERSGGVGGRDLWMTTRPTTSDPWGAPDNLGPTVNSSGLDEGASLSSDGLTLFFMSNRENHSGPFDLWMTTRSSALDPWGIATKLPSSINSSFGENAPEISVDGNTLFFASNRPGGSGGFDLWMAPIVPEPSTYVMAMTSLLLFGIYGWRRRGPMNRKGKYDG